MDRASPPAGGWRARCSSKARDDSPIGLFDRASPLAGFWLNPLLIHRPLPIEPRLRSSWAALRSSGNRSPPPLTRPPRRRPPPPPPPRRRRQRLSWGATICSSSTEGRSSGIEIRSGHRDTFLVRRDLLADGDAPQLVHGDPRSRARHARALSARRRPNHTRQTPLVRERVASQVLAAGWNAVAAVGRCAGGAVGAAGGRGAAFARGCGPWTPSIT
jgi:hypothetical protein